MRRLNLRTLQFGASSELARTLRVEVDPFSFGGFEYDVRGAAVALDLDVSRVGARLTLHGAGEAVLEGPCQRCLEQAAVTVPFAAEEHVAEGESEDGDDGEYYTRGGFIDLERWVRDALAAALPSQLLCGDDCRGLCPECGADLNRAGEHGHDEPAT